MSKKSKRLQAFLAEHPLCCYCGAPAVTLDHVPSTQMFRRQDRPKGLEVPACRRCNGLTGRAEQLAALLGRGYPDSRTAEELQEHRKLVEAVADDDRDLFLELVATPEQQAEVTCIGPPGTVAANLSGDRVREHLELFAAKMTIALHYECTREVLPPTAGVWVYFFTNMDRAKRRILPKMTTSEYITLRQGKKDVGDQFSYSVDAMTKQKTRGVYEAYFFQSFMTWGTVMRNALVFFEAEKTVRDMAEAVVDDPVWGSVRRGSVVAPTVRAARIEIFGRGLMRCEA